MLYLSALNHDSTSDPFLPYPHFSTLSEGNMSPAVNGRVSRLWFIGEREKKAINACPPKNKHNPSDHFWALGSDRSCPTALLLWKCQYWEIQCYSGVTLITETCHVKNKCSISSQTKSVWGKKNNNETFSLYLVTMACTKCSVHSTSKCKIENPAVGNTQNASMPYYLQVEEKWKVSKGHELIKLITCAREGLLPASC